MRKARSLVLAALICAAAGCMPHAERRRIYALDTALEASRAADTPLRGARPELQLQRVLVPDYLDSTDLLLRAGAHEIRESSTGRFGERLSLGVTHALRSDLAMRLPFDTIALAQPSERSALQILITVDAFDVWPDGHCVLAASWSMLSADRRALLTAGRDTFVAVPAGGNTSNDAAIVATMADAVGQLADRIASAARAAAP